MDVLNFTSAFYVVTGVNTWGRHLELAEAFKAAKIKQDEKKINYILTVFLFAEETPDEVRLNVLNCYYVNDWGNISRCSNLSKEDEQQIETYLKGYTYYNNIKVVAKTQTKKVNNP